jgi:hypothetical protein
MTVTEFWEQKGSLFPRLAKIAQQLLCVPATNLSSERNFNYAGLTVTDRRSRIEPDMLDQLLFIRSNFDMLKHV